MSNTTFAVTPQTFTDDVLNATTPVLVDFWADWCGPCRAIAPILEELAAVTAGRLSIAKLDANAYPDTARAYGISSIPTMILFKNGAPVTRMVGTQTKTALLAQLATHIDVAPRSTSPDEKFG